MSVEDADQSFIAVGTRGGRTGDVQGYIIVLTEEGEGRGSSCSATQYSLLSSGGGSVSKRRQGMPVCFRVVVWYGGGFLTRPEWFSVVNTVSNKT